MASLKRMRYQDIRSQLSHSPKTWLITGVAGFIGSHLLEHLLSLDQTVVGLDNFSTSDRRNLEHIRTHLPLYQWNRFRFVEGDIRHLATCQEVCQSVDVVLHHAALGSVPRSLENPILTNDNNITGFLNMLVAARDASVQRFIYAASSSTYGDHPDLPKVEDRIGRPLSPYAVTKYVNELYADVFNRSYGLPVVGLRYFNVFGPRQSPTGAYAAVIPRWFANMTNNQPVYINGDGETSRDFCYVDNVVQMNIRAACFSDAPMTSQIYNVAFSEATTLNMLFHLIREQVLIHRPDLPIPDPIYRDFRAGDVRHSLASIDKSRQLLGYAPEFSVRQGLVRSASWYLAD